MHIMYLYLLLAEDARERARVFHRNSQRGIFIAAICPGQMERVYLPIRILHSDTVQLPAWRTKNNITFLSTVDLRKHLRVDVRVSSPKEWLVVEDIPAKMITVVERL
jgi:hypothetical protein